MDEEINKLHPAWKTFTHGMLTAEHTLRAVQFVLIMFKISLRLSASIQVIPLNKLNLCQLYTNDDLYK